MNPYLIVVALLAVMGAGYGGFRLGVDHEVASQAREDQQITKAVDAANTTAANAIAKLKPKYTTITQEVQREVRTEIRYSDCRNTPGVMQQLNQALRPETPAPSSSKLPDADPAK